MTRSLRVLVLGVALISSWAEAQDTSPAARARAARVIPTGAMDQHAAAVGSTTLAADALRQAVELEAARRVAPFDLEWGTP